MVLIENFGPPKRLIKREEKWFGQGLSSIHQNGNAAVTMNSRIFREEKGSWEIREETYPKRDDFDPQISRLRHKDGGK